MADNKDKIKELINAINKLSEEFAWDEQADELMGYVSALIKAVREDTLTCKFCGEVHDQIYCHCDAFNDE